MNKYLLILISVIIVFLVWSEYGSQDCRTQTCMNKAKLIHINDSKKEIIDKIVESINRNHKMVDWRRVMFIAIIISLVINLYVSGQDFDGFNLFIVAFIVFLVLYTFSTHFQSSHMKNNDQKIVDSLYILRKKN